MSTRSIVGGLTDGGTYAVYVHNDGYPDGRLPVLEALIKRDGANKVLATLLSGREGGWSYLDDTTGADGRTPGHGRIVEGYGCAYNDAPDATPLRFPEEYNDDSWIEWVYLISETGTIRFAATQRGVKPEEWNWNEHAMAVGP